MLCWASFIHKTKQFRKTFSKILFFCLFYKGNNNNNNNNNNELPWIFKLWRCLCECDIELQSTCYEGISFATKDVVLKWNNLVTKFPLNHKWFWQPQQQQNKRNSFFDQTFCRIRMLHNNIEEKPPMFCLLLFCSWYETPFSISSVQVCVKVSSELVLELNSRSLHTHSPLGRCSAFVDRKKWNKKEIVQKYISPFFCRILNNFYSKMFLHLYLSIKVKEWYFSQQQHQFSVGENQDLFRKQTNIFCIFFLCSAQ